MTKNTILKKFSDLEIGDVIYGTDGTETTVTEAYDEHLPETMYEIEIEDGSIVKASGNHLWYIQTSLDLTLHHDRRKIGKKYFGKLPEAAITELLRIAEYTGDEELETALIDIIVLLDVENNEEAINSIVRVAESIGPISESSVKTRDLYLYEDTIVNTVRGYDARRFAEQVLSLTGERKYKKRWPLLAGRVVTTEQMIELSKNFEIHLPKS